MDFVSVILNHAKLHPHDPAIIVDNRVASYFALSQAALLIEERLRAYALARGSLVVIGVNDPILHVGAILASYRLGLPSLSMRESDVALPDVLEPKLYVTGQTEAEFPGVPRLVLEAAALTGDVKYVKRAPDAIRPDELSRITLSSGTTGRPKPIGFTGGDLEQRMAAYLGRMSTPEWSRLLCMPGLATNFGFSFTMAALWSGKTVAFANEGFQALTLINFYKLDSCVASPQQLSALMQAQTQQPVTLASLTSVHIGGSVLLRSFLMDLRARICQHIIGAYGSTEGGTVAYAPSHRTVWVDGAVGFVAPWATVEVVDEANNPLPINTDGIIRIRADGQGRPMEDGRLGEGADWFYPGDRGKLLIDNQLIISGRTNELINSGGVKIAPDALEDAIKKNPDITDAGVVGVYGAHGVQEVWVGVTVAGDMNAGQVLEYIRSVNTGALVQRAVILPKIPRNALGKVVREELRKAINDLYNASMN